MKDPEYKERIYRQHRKWVEGNAVKRAAHVIVGNRIRDGSLTKQPCEVCGETKVDAHHNDYENPLEVRWLCRKHHAEHHKNERKKDRKNVTNKLRSMLRPNG